MMFDVVNVHSIVKCLTMFTEGIGPQVDIDTVKGIAETLKFRVGEREYRDRKGSMVFEYVFERRRESGNIIIFSGNGFSVDANDLTLLEDYIAMAYNWMEEGVEATGFAKSQDASKAHLLGRLAIQGMFECIVQPLTKKTTGEYFQHLFSLGKKVRRFKGFNRSLYPFGITLVSGKPQQPGVSERLTIKVEPFVKDANYKFWVSVNCTFKTIDDVYLRIHNVKKDVKSFLRNLFTKRS